MEKASEYQYILNLTQREVDSYDWRVNSESKSPSYCGSTSFEHHIQQVRDPDSWVSESMLKAWEKEYIRDSQPPLPELVEKLQAKLDVVRGIVYEMGEDTRLGSEAIGSGVRTVWNLSGTYGRSTQWGRQVINREEYIDDYGLK